MVFICPFGSRTSSAPSTPIWLGKSASSISYLQRNRCTQSHVTKKSRRAFFSSNKSLSMSPFAAREFSSAEAASPLSISNTAAEGLLESHLFSAEERVRVLSEALPYMQKFTGKTFVIKYGGAAMKDSSLKEFVIRDLVFLSVVGIRPIFVHGGGPEINQWLSKVGIEPVFKNGLRVTDGPTMEVVEMVLTGKVNKELVSLINAAGGRAVGLSGKDGKLVIAQPEDPQYGFVGFPKTVNPLVLDTLTGAGYIPVVASVAADEAGQSYNINADTVAGEIAAALNAEKLILLTDVPGIMKDFKDISTLFSKLTISEANAFIESGVISGGMIPKVKGCINVLEKGVNATHIIDGKRPHSLLLEIFTDGGIGSMVTHDEP